MIVALIGLGSILILFPAWLPSQPRIPVEESAVEVLQSALLGFSAALFFATSSHAGAFAPIYRCLGLAAVSALLGEIGNSIDPLMDPVRHEYIVGLLFAWILLTLLRNRRPLTRFIGLAARHPASGFIISALIVVYAFNRVFGSSAFWNATLDGEHHPKTPEVCKAYLELLACYLVLLGSIGFCLPLTRRRYRVEPDTTEP